jgi:hypothetical protein
MTSGSKILAALDDGGIADALVSTLKHESPNCVAAAVGALCTIGKTPGGGEALFVASGAIPALVGVIRKARPPGGPEDKKSIFARYAHATYQMSAYSYGPRCVFVRYIHGCGHPVSFCIDTSHA